MKSSCKDCERGVEEFDGIKVVGFVLVHEK